MTGTVTVTGAPPGFTPGEIGAGACPAAGPVGMACEDPQYGFLDANHEYTLSLTPGKWTIAGFYETAAFSGVFLGTSVVIDVPSGVTVKQNLTVPYSAPATLTGTIKVTGVPPTDPVQQFMILLCPSFAPYNGTTQSIACVNGYATPPSAGATSATYQITGLPPGSWTAYPGFCAQTGCGFNAQDGVPVTFQAGRTTRANLTTSFLLPGQALLSGSVSVRRAPPGFTNPVGVTACQQGTTPCQTFYVTSGNRFNFVLKAGAYTVNGFYLASPFDNAVDGPSSPVTLVAGRTKNVNLSVTYRVPGSAVGTIRVTGAHPGVAITAYTVLACPSADPWTGGIAGPQCVNEYSGQAGFQYGPANSTLTPGPVADTNPPSGFKGAAALSPTNRYLMALTPGDWLLYPGYQTVFGAVVNHTATTVRIRSQRTTNHLLTVRYQTPTQAAVTGTVDVVGAPANNFEAGVEACTAAPTATTCAGEQEAFAGLNGTYTLLLTPGTWWVRGFVYTFFGFSSTQSTSAATVVRAQPGLVTTKNFLVTVSQ